METTMKIRIYSKRVQTCRQPPVRCYSVFNLAATWLISMAQKRNIQFDHLIMKIQISGSGENTSIWPF